MHGARSDSRSRPSGHFRRPGPDPEPSLTEIVQKLDARCPQGADDGIFAGTLQGVMPLLELADGAAAHTGRDREILLGPVHQGAAGAAGGGQKARHARGPVINLFG